MRMITDFYRRIYYQWQLLFNLDSVNFRIFRAIIVIGGVTLVTKLVSMVKDVKVASVFGTSDSMDAFLAAFVIPTYCINVVAGSFNAALIPAYITVRDNKGPEKALQLFLGFTTVSIALLIVITIMIEMSSSYTLPLLSIGFDQNKAGLTKYLFYWLLLSIPLSGLANIWIAILNANEQFTGATITSIMVPVVQICTLFWVKYSVQINLLAWGTIGGFVAQLCLLGLLLHKNGIALIPVWPTLDADMRMVIKQYLPMVAGASLMSSNLIIDQAMAATLGPGSIAILSYSNRIVALVLSIGTMALSTAILPYFSKMIAASKWTAIKKSIRTYILLILLTSVPVTLLLMAFSTSIISFLYEYGSFTTEDSNLAAKVQIMYAIQIPFYTLSILVVRVISALKANQVLMRGAVLNIILNFACNYFLTGYMGVAGIALSTSLVYIVSFLYLYISMNNILRTNHEYISTIR